MTDIWVCGTCHSINRQRNAKCYKCGAKQDMSASGPLADLRTERALIQRAARPYRSSLIFAIIASAFILLVAGLGIIVLNESIGAYRFLRDQLPAIVGGSFTEQELAVALLPTIVPVIVSTLVSLIALFAFALWLSRVVANIPALGGGEPSVSSTRAFFAPFIPVYNLIKVPPIIQQAMYRTDPRAGGFFMIALAWVGLVGSAIVGYVVERWLALRIDSIFFNATSVGQVVDELTAAVNIAIIVDIVTTLMVSVGAVILVVVMLRIERRARARDREIRRGIHAMVDREGAERDAARARQQAPEAAAAGFLVPDGAGLPDGAGGTAGGSPTPLELPRRAPHGIGMAVAATTLGASPTGQPPTTALGASPTDQPPTTSMGPSLRLTVSGGTIVASLDGDVNEPATLDELREAARSLAEAGGTATVHVADATDDAAAELAGEVVSILRDAGVPSTLG